jgi:hypothetical protein
MKSKSPGYDSLVWAGTYTVTLGENICLFYAYYTRQYTMFVLLHVNCILILLRDVLLGLILELRVGKRLREMPQILKFLTHY